MCYNSSKEIYGGLQRHFRTGICFRLHGSMNIEGSESILLFDLIFVNGFDESNFIRCKVK